MSFKSFLTSLSTLELVFILLGIVAPILCLVWVFLLLGVTRPVFVPQERSSSAPPGRVYFTNPELSRGNRQTPCMETIISLIFFLSRRYPTIFSKSSGCPRTDAFVEKRSADSGEERR